MMKNCANFYQKYGQYVYAHTHMYTPHTCELDIHGQYIYDIYKGQEAWKVCISPNYCQRIELFSPNEPAPNWLAGLIHSV